MKGQLITLGSFSLYLPSCSGFQALNDAKKGQCVHNADNVRGKDGGGKMEIGCWRCERRGKSACSDRRRKKRRGERRVFVLVSDGIDPFFLIHAFNHRFLRTLLVKMVPGLELFPFRDTFSSGAHIT
ncbi:hypothetical protein BDV26DRAFT_276011 [Aspergillus bertholletiae]|uniref:Uncharacterized protein n=1 Tax=Aspergillus bertholletiae TaxID=1226010 RepID=A0A5N7ANN8_9EURO|nr:hypothetical protein BDV26DRAFT_276011 [Aspergillus bertholletiae]